MQVNTDTARAPQRAHSPRAAALAALFALAAAGCVYEMPIQQGNHLDADTLAQVHKGMTRSQVRYLLGTPMVPDAFDQDRWEYGYLLKVRQLKVQQRHHATVYFKDDLVDRVESDVQGNHAEPVSDKPVTSPEA